MASSDVGRYFAETTHLTGDYGASPFSGIAAHDVERVVERTRSLVPSLERWRANYPSLLPQRATASMFAAAAMLPDASDDILLHIAQIYLVLFAMDDIVDGEIENYDQAQIETVLQHYAAIARSPDRHDWGDVDAFDPIERAAQDVFRGLQQARGAAHSYTTWLRTFDRFLECFAIEATMARTFRDTGVLPTFDEYMAIGQTTIAVPTFGWMMVVVLVADSVDGKGVDAAINRSLVECGRGVRLLNDVRSYRREQAEGKPNSLTILIAQGMGEIEAEHEIVRRADAHLAALAVEIAALPASCSAWGVAMLRLGQFLRGFYLSREFHDFRLDPSL